MVREMTLRHFFPSLLPLFTASSAVTPSATWRKGEKEKRENHQMSFQCYLKSLELRLRVVKKNSNLSHWHEFPRWHGSQVIKIFSQTKKSVCGNGVCVRTCYCHPQSISLSLCSTNTHTQTHKRSTVVLESTVLESVTRLHLQTNCVKLRAYYWHLKMSFSRFWGS